MLQVSYRDKPGIPPEQSPSGSRSCARTAPAENATIIDEAEDQKTRGTKERFSPLKWRSGRNLSLQSRREWWAAALPGGVRREAAGRTGWAKNQERVSKTKASFFLTTLLSTQTLFWTVSLVTSACRTFRACRWIKTTRSHRSSEDTSGWYKCVYDQPLLRSADSKKRHRRTFCLHLVVASGNTQYLQDSDRKTSTSMKIISCSSTPTCLTSKYNQSDVRGCLRNSVGL